MYYNIINPSINVTEVKKLVGKKNKISNENLKEAIVKSIATKKEMNREYLINKKENPKY